MSIDDSDKLYSDKSIYSYNAPVLTTLSDGSMLLLWVDEKRKKNDKKRLFFICIQNKKTVFLVYD